MIVVVSTVMVMTVITAEAEKTALVGTVWTIVRIDVTHFPGVAVAIAGIESGSVGSVGSLGFIAGA